MQTTNTAQDAERSKQVLAAIALYKFLKAGGCILLAAFAWRLLDPVRAAGFGQWLESLHWMTRYGLAARLVDRLLGLDHQQFVLLGSIASGYALLYLVQGFGLWSGKRWAEYLVVVESSLLLPLEAWELAHRFTLFKLGVLVANLAIVVYLVFLLRRRPVP